MGNQTDHTYLERLGSAAADWRLLNGEAQSTGQLFTGVSDGNEKAIYINNPENAVYLAIAGVNIRSDGKLLVDKAFNVTENTEGDAPETGTTNKRSDADGTNAVVRVGGDNETGAYSGGESFSTKTAGGGGATPRVRPGETFEELANVVAPGDNIYISATNDSGGTSDISIDIDWFEIDRQSFP